MAATRGSAHPELIMDPAPWAHEEVGEDVVLAQFADESALGTTGPVPAAPLNIVQPAGSWRAGWDRRRVADVMRTAIVACLTAMALGASFAIGFGYIWSDRLPPASPTQGQLTSDAPRIPRPIWWMPLLPAVGSTTKPSEPKATDEATPRQGETSQRQRASGGETAQTAARTSSRAVAASPVAARPLTGPSVAPTLRIDHGAAPLAADVGDTVPASTRDVAAVALPAPVLDSRGIGAPFAESIADTARPVPLLPSSSTGMVGVSTETGSAARTAANRADIDAVRHTISLYQSAYSHMDVGAMAAVWPSLDTAGVERAFAGVERQALTLSECRVTTAGTLATAVCPGQVRYVGRVGGRQLQERQGIWTIALERRDNSWQVVRLNVRESAPAGRVPPSRKP